MAFNLQASIEIAGVDAVMIVFDAKVDKQINQQVHLLREAIIQAQPVWLSDVVAAYHTLMVVYDIQRTTFEHVQHWLKAQLIELRQRQVTPKVAGVHEYFVCYEPEFALDIERVCHFTGLSAEEVSQRHSAETYHVYTIGFAPGFAYLGDVPNALQVARLDTPRTKVPAGSVAIANQQTAIYPRTSPGGWNIIGRVAGWTDRSGLKLQAGDQVRFTSVSKQRFLEIEANSQSNHIEERHDD
ncbi:MAG: allophanate hydrolase [Idiomarina sp.]|nr:MAG: allophanate hydrolase [Idiomarina sp.]